MTNSLSFISLLLKTELFTTAYDSLLAPLIVVTVFTVRVGERNF